MRIFTLLLLFTILTCSSQAQDFSNKGTDFWTGFGPHERINGGGACFMTLYFTSDEAATVTIYVGTTLIQTLNLTANTIVKSNDIPQTGATDARLLNEGLIAKRGINIKSTKPIVAYAQIWGSKVTATTVLFPVVTLGRTYTALNYTQISNCNSNYCKSYCFVVATEDNTVVQVKPSAATESGLAVNQFNTTTNQKILNKGDVWLIKGLTPTIDITGTQVRSISNSAGECKPIAFFSGSGKISITCSPSDASSDNLFQQAPPIVAWGRKYVTAPTATDASQTGTKTYSYNVYRVMVNPDGPATTVSINGVTLPGTVPNVGTAATPIGAGTNSITLKNNLFYEFVSNQPLVIEASQPVMVAQYISNRDKCSNNASSVGDPDMVYLSPVEQTLDKIIVAPVPSENNDAFNFLNVVMRTSDVSNFSITDRNNSPVPFTFIPIPSSIYSYAQITLAQGYTAVNSNYYKVSSTGAGFNAIAYGYAQSESYAYNAGTNVKNLYQTLAINNDKVNKYSAGACTKTPANIGIALNYKPTKLIWDFGGNVNVSPNTVITQQPPAEPSETIKAADSITVLYIYKLPQQYTFNTSGTYTLKVTGTNPNSDGCTDIEHKFDIVVTDGPTSNFKFNFAGGCASDPIQFTDQSVPAALPITEWQWDYGDNTTDNVASPLKLFNSGGTKNITLTVIDKAGCIGENTQSIVIPPSPTSKFSVKGTQCTGSTITFTDSSLILTPAGVTLTKWHWDFGEGTVRDLTASADQTFTYTAAGTYDVTLQVESSTGCKTTYKFTLVIGAVPVSKFTLPASICLPGDAQFTNNTTVAGNVPLTYLWDFGDAKTSTDIDPLHAYSDVGGGPFTVKLTASVAGCSNTSSQLFSNVYLRPLALAASDPNISHCQNTKLLLEDVSSTRGPGTIRSIQWFWGDGQTSTGKNVDHLYASEGVYQIKQVVTSDKGCISDTNRINVTIYAAPDAKFSFIGDCTTKTVVFTDESTITSGSTFSWSWKFGDAQTSTQKSPTHIYASSGQAYSTEFVVFSDKGCSDTLVKQVVLGNSPIVDFNFSPENICLPNGLVSFTNTTTISDGSDASIIYEWDFGDNSQKDANKNTVHPFSDAGPYTVKLKATSNAGCISEKDSVINTIFQQPVAALSVNAQNCIGTDVSFTDNSTAQKSSISTWEWDFGDNNSSTDKNPSHIYANTGSYNVTLKVTSAAGCESAVSTPFVVTINPLPVAAFEPDFRLCENKAVRFTDMSSPNVGTISEWHWNFGDGKTSDIKDPENIFTVAKTYPVNLWVKNSAGCESAKDLIINVTIEPNPIADFTFGDACFPDGTAIFKDNTSPNGSAAITEWTWDFGDNGIGSGNEPTNTYATGGKYNVTMTAFAGNGCSAVITKAVEVMDKPTPTFTIDTVTNKICSNAPVNLVANAIVNGYGTVKKIDIFWDYLNNPAATSTDNSPALNKAYSYQYPVFGSPASKTVQVLVRAYSNSDCYRDSTMDLVLYAAPNALFTALDPVCQEDAAFNLTEGSEQSGLPGIEAYSGTGITTSPEFSPIVAGPGTHAITYTFTSDGGCTSSATQSIVVDPTPVLDYGGIRSLLEGDSTRLNPVTATGNGLIYLWDKADYLSSTTISNPVVRPLEDIVYTITATSQAGCVATNTLIVKILKDFIIPNTFTPNNDGINDFWVIDQLKFYPEFKLMIFNRYGQLLYETSRYDRPWDGNYKGKSLPFGTYYYILDLNGWKEPKKGYVTILK